MKRRKAYAAIVLAGLMMTSTCMTSMAATTSNEITQREKDNAALAKTVAEEGMVLLENKDQALPVQEENIALFGNGAIRTIRGRHRFRRPVQRRTQRRRRCTRRLKREIPHQYL